MPIEIRNPAAPDEIVATYDETPMDALNGCVARARAAQAEWAVTPQPERGVLVAKFVDALEARTEDIALSITKEMGKPLGEARGEVGKAIGEARACIGRASAPIGEVFPSQVPGTVAYSTRRPRGVVLGINPWNFPFSTPMRKGIPALVYGNAILLKPASLTPGAIALMAEIAAETLPVDVVQAVIGGGALGQALSEHPGVDAVSFTGSVDVGKRVGMAAASHLAEVSLELGGKNPAILNDASNLDAVLDQIMAAAFAVCGQRCTAVSRVIVSRDLEADVVAGLVARANAMQPVDGTGDGAKIGPLSSAQQLEDVHGFVTRAKSEGATIAAGGEKLETSTGGYFYAPTIVSNVSHAMEIATDEVFGPVLAVVAYDTVDEAMRIANDVEFGLSSCLYSERTDVVERFVAESETGMIHVNAGSFPENHLPFVGVKNSAMGVGGSNGPSTIQFYTTEHTVYRRASVKAMSDAPNILMIMADQLAPQSLAAYGNPVCKTPNLNRLAEKSVVFDNAYSNYPLCVPSRASMMSGRLTPAINVWDNACELASSQPTIAHHLRHLGYHTVLSGKMHFIGPDQTHGFNERIVTDVYPSGFDWVADWQAGPAFVPSATGLNGVVDAGPAARTLQEDYDEEVAHASVQSIYDLARRGDDAGPWFQLASFTSPHTPFVADQKYWDRYDPDDLDMPKVDTLAFEDLDYASRALFFAHGRHRHKVTTDDLRRARHGYYAMISFIDDKVGELIEALEASGQADNTVVLFCADHGEMLGERGMWFKQSFFEWSARVPLMISAPSKYAPRRAKDCVSLVDLLPTLVGIGGGDVTLACDGESLEPALNGDKTRDLVISDYYGIGPCVPHRMVRRGPFKLIYTHGHPDLLFDLESDPDELRNLADDVGHAGKLAELRAILMDGWDPDAIDAQIRISQAERLFLKGTPGPQETWDFIARTGDDTRFVRPGTGGVDGTKAQRRLPKLTPVPPHFPELSQRDVADLIEGKTPPPTYFSEDVCNAD